MVHFPIQQSLPLIEAGDTEIERLNEVSNFEPKERVSEDGEASTAKTKAEDESKVSKDAVNA